MNARQVAALLGLLAGGSGDTPAAARVIDVPNDYPRIQEAIDAAIDGDVVLVQPGTYFEVLNFDGKAITVSGTAPEDSMVVAQTVVDGHGQSSVVTFDSDETRSTVLTGVTLTNGAGNGYPSRAGGAIYCSSSPRIDHCVITENQADFGGGVFVIYGGGPRFFRCVIEGNSSRDGPGGGLYSYDESAPVLEECVVRANFSGNTGGGAWFLGGSSEVRSCLIENNEAIAGGGLALRDQELIVEDCVIRRNTASGGGGLQVVRCDGSIRNCIVIENDAGDGAGVLFSENSPVFENCIIADNLARYEGGALWIQYGSLSLVNCVVANNRSGSYGGIYAAFGSCSLNSSVVWGNRPNQLVGSVAVRYSDVEDGWPGEGNIDADPLFRSFRGFDYLLAPHSPCIDTGDPDIEDRLSDWHRWWPDWYPNRPRSDMGAYGGAGNWRWLR